MNQSPFLFPAGEFSGWSHITALWPRPLFFFRPSLSGLIFPLQRAEYSSLTGSPKWTLLSSCTTKVPLCGVTQAFFPGDSVISISVVMAMRRGGRKMGALTSGSSRLPGQTVHLGRAGSGTLPVCLCADNAATWGGETGTLWRYLSNAMWRSWGHMGEGGWDLWYSKWQ